MIPPPPRTQQSEWLNHITMHRVDELRVNVWLIRCASANDGTHALGGFAQRVDVYVGIALRLGLNESEPRGYLLDGTLALKRVHHSHPLFGKCTRFSGARIDSLEVRKLW